jgi:hypothetical protein
MCLIPVDKLRSSGTGLSWHSARGDSLAPAIKLAGFLVLLVLIFAGAHMAGARLGPVTTGHSQVQYTGGTGGAPGMGGMNMGGSNP